jgi:uncharacterized membrane protein
MKTTLRLLVNTLIFAKIIAPALCFVGLNLSVNKNVIEQYIQDVLKKPAAQAVSAVVLTSLGSLIIALSTPTIQFNLINALGLAFLLGGTIKMSFSQQYCDCIKWIGADAYVRILGFLFVFYSLVLFSSSLL